MPLSGATVSPKLRTRFDAFKMSGTSDKVDFIVCEIKDGVIGIQADPDFGTTAEDTGKKHINGVPSNYLAMEKLCKDGMCRYAFYTFRWEEGARKMSSIVLICYSNDEADSKLKMLYSSSKGALTQSCKGVGQTIQANDDDDINYYTILKELSKGKADVNKELND